MSIYYVDMAVGNDANAGTDEGSGNAWKTIDKAMNTVVAGDKVWVKASADYTEVATIDTAGTATAPIVFEGYTTTTGDGGRATITGSSSRANCITVSIGGSFFYAFKNFRFTAATGNGVNTSATKVTYKNCKFDANGGIGLNGLDLICEGCEFISNTSYGVQTSNSTGLEHGVFIGCRFDNNGDVAIQADTHVVVLECTFFSNGLQAISYTLTGGLCVVVNCTFDGDGKDTTVGIEVTKTNATVALVNNAIYDCVTGVSNTLGNKGESVVSRNNLVNANTTAYNNAATFTGEVTAAPVFVDEVAGADYHPDTGSPLIDAGFDGGVSMAIGAVQPVTQAATNVFKLRIGV